MNYRIIFLIVFVPISFPLNSQTLAPCGTTPYKSPWLKEYQQHPLPSTSRSNQDDILYLPMAVHSVGEDDGDGHFGTVRILDAFCQLNADFQESDIQFYLTEDIRLINNSAIYEHDSIHFMGLYMLENDLPNALNTYLVQNPAGNCGYNLPWASMTVAKLCANTTSSTWAHEVGHHFTIQHPFLGWEMGISYDGSIAPDYNQPAPEFVLYNYTIFKDQPFVDTLIIDTAIVEKLDGSNCHIAADGFCDTAPDYLTGRWECNSSGESRTLQTDPNGATFRSDASLIMGNAEDGCSRRFTPQQIAAMRTYVQEQRQDLFINPLAFQEPTTATATLLFPIGSSDVPVDAVELSWEEVPNATRYIIQISRLSSFPEGLTTTHETDQTSILIENLITERDYHWRVRAYNAFHTCTEFSASEEFEVVKSVTSVNTIKQLEDLQILPTLQQAGKPIQVILESNSSFTGTLEVVNLFGQSFYNEEVTIRNKKEVFAIPTATLPSGLYYVGIRTNKGLFYQKIVIE